MSVRSFVHISAVALACTAAAVFGSMRPTAQQSVVIASVTGQPGQVRAVDLTTNTEIGVFADQVIAGSHQPWAIDSIRLTVTNVSGKSNESSDHLL